MRRVFGSFLSALAGTIAGAAISVMGFGAWSEPGVFVLAFLVTGAVVLPIWLFVVLPLYVLVPLSSIFWRPAICIAGGCIFGAGPLALYGLCSWPDWQGWPLLLIAAIVGGAISAFASLTAPHFHRDNSHSQRKT